MIRLVGYWDEPGEGSGQACYYHVRCRWHLPSSGVVLSHGIDHRSSQISSRDSGSCSDPRHRPITDEQGAERNRAVETARRMPADLLPTANRSEAAPPGEGRPPCGWWTSRNRLILVGPAHRCSRRHAAGLAPTQVDKVTRPRGVVRHIRPIFLEYYGNPYAAGRADHSAPARRPPRPPDGRLLLFLRRRS